VASDRPGLIAALFAGGSVFPEDELDALAAAASTDAELRALVARRVAGEPVEYLVGHAEFAGLQLRVASGVFVPRFRTEFLAGLAADRVVSGQRLLDLGCGVGTIAAFVASRVSGVWITAVDVDPVALECACVNLPGATVVLAGRPGELPAGPFDLIVANLPYVPSVEVALMPRDARDHEFLAALDGGPDGLGPLRLYAPGLPRLLAQGGRFLVEVAEDQASGACGILQDAGLASVSVHHDEEVDATVIEASHSSTLTAGSHGHTPRRGRCEPAVDASPGASGAW
jgi:release factor glutamine methyltransferase